MHGTRRKVRREDRPCQEGHCFGGGDTVNRAPVQFFETLKGKNGKWKLRHSESFRPLSPALLERTPGFSYAAVAATAVANACVGSATDSVASGIAVTGVAEGTNASVAGSMGSTMVSTAC